MKDATEIRAVETNDAPSAIGPYSQAVVTDDWIFCSGQIAIDPVSGSIPEGIEDQTHQVLRNLSAVLESAGSGLDKVIKTTVYLTDLEQFPVMNEIYASYFPQTPPARSTVEVSALPRGVVVEIDAVARVDLTQGEGDAS